MSNQGKPLFHFICWNCQEIGLKHSTFCGFCKKLQPVQEINAFTRLGLEPSLEISNETLETAYIQATNVHHPDRFIHSNQERTYAQDQMSALNKAYQTLKYGRTRVIALYEGIFGPYSSETVICTDFFLEAIFDLQEKAMHLTLPSEKKDFYDQIHTRIRLVEGELKEAFQEYDLQLAARAIKQYQYLTKLITTENDEYPFHAVTNL